VGMRVRERGAPCAGAGARRQPRNESGGRAERRAARVRPAEDGDGWARAAAFQCATRVRAGQNECPAVPRPPA